MPPDLAVRASLERIFKNHLFPSMADGTLLDEDYELYKVITTI